MLVRFSVATLMMIGLLGSVVNAAPMLVSDVNGVTGVTGLVVGSETYDATFVEGSYDAVFANSSLVPTFLNDSSGAQSAANALIAFFNAESVQPINLAFFGGTNANDADLVIPWQVNLSSMDAFNVDWDQPNGPWVLQPQNWNRDFDNDLVAMVIFSPSAAAEVPEPASLALWSLMSVAGLAAWRKRKMAKAIA